MWSESHKAIKDMSDKCRKEIAKREEKARVLKEKASTLPGYLRTSVPRSLLSGTTQLCAQRAAAGSLVCPDASSSSVTSSL